MFEAKKQWRQEAEKDKLLSKLNATIHSLQVMAKEANSRFKSSNETKYALFLKTTVVLLTDLRKLSSKFFESGADTDSTEVTKQLEKYDMITSKLLSKLPGFSLPGGDMDREQLRQEKEHIEVLFQSSSGYNGRRFEVLLSILNDVRSYERTFAFQKRLQMEKKTTAEILECSIDQFSYGTTRFSLWKTLLDHESIKARMQRSRLLSMEPKVYIFGSSLGLLSYFTAIYYPNCYSVSMHA